MLGYLSEGFTLEAFTFHGEKNEEEEEGKCIRVSVPVPCLESSAYMEVGEVYFAGISTLLSRA